MYIYIYTRTYASIYNNRVNPILSLVHSHNVTLVMSAENCANERLPLPSVSTDAIIRSAFKNENRKTNSQCAPGPARKAAIWSRRRLPPST